MGKPQMDTGQEGALAAAVGAAALAEVLPNLHLRPRSAGTATGTLGKLAESLQTQRAKQLRRLQQMTTRAADHAKAQREAAERERREKARQEDRQLLQQQTIAANQRRAEIAEDRRRRKLVAQQQREEELRRVAAAKLAHGSARAAAVAAERHEVAALARVKHAVGAARKVEAVRQRANMEDAEKGAFMQQKMQRHQEAVQKAAEEKRAVEEARRAEEERREAARRQALARAEAEMAERADWLARRQQAKESQLEARGRELGELRALHQRQRHMRAAYARHRQELAAQHEEERRRQLTDKLAAKQQRVAAMEQERAGMLRALEEVRREIRLQEDGLREALRLMEERGGAAVHDLQELQRQLADVMQQPMRSARCSINSSRGSSRQTHVAAVRPASRGLPASAAQPAPLSATRQPAPPVHGRPASSGAAYEQPLGSPESPRIQAVYGDADAYSDAEDEDADVCLDLHMEPSDGGSPGADQAAAARGGSNSSTPEPGDGYSTQALSPVCASDTQAKQQQAGCHQQQPGQQLPQKPPQQAQPEWRQQVACAARGKLQQLLEAEMGREAEREALLAKACEPGDRRRLLQYFELERANAMALMQQLQRQMG